MTNFRYTTRTYPYTGTIAAGSDVTGVIDMIGVPLIGIEVPTPFKGDMIFINVSTDGTTFKKMYNPNGVRMSVRARPDCYICIAPDDFRGIRYIQLESSSIEADERTITVYGRVDS